MNYRKIQAFFSIATSQIQKMLHDDLWVLKLVFCYKPQSLSNDQNGVCFNWYWITQHLFNKAGSYFVVSIDYPPQPDDDDKNGSYLQTMSKMGESVAVGKKSFELRYVVLFNSKSF